MFHSIQQIKKEKFPKDEIQVMSFLANTNFNFNSISSSDLTKYYENLSPMRNYYNTQDPTRITPVSLPQSSPEPEQDEPIDYSTKSKKTDTYQELERIDFIGMKFKTKKLPCYNKTETESSKSSTHSEQFTIPEVIQKTPQRKTNISPVEMQDDIQNWKGDSIFSNLSQTVMSEFDKMLKESYKTKSEVIKKLHEESPINYDYNHKKSRTRVDYSDDFIRDSRTKNNLASRKSRHRKKFNLTINEYSVDYDHDENGLMENQIQWLKNLIGGLEKEFVKTSSSDDLEALRHRFGLK